MLKMRFCCYVFIVYHEVYSVKVFFCVNVKIFTLQGKSLSEVREILNARRVRHGEFDAHAEIAQGLKYVIREAGRNKGLDPAQEEALDMIAHKIARILNGDPNYQDHWIDIAGYATLVADRLPND